MAEGRNDMRHGFDLLKRTGWKASLLAVISSLLIVTLALAAGQLDTSFSQDGLQKTDFAGGDDGAEAVLIQPNGKIVAVGAKVNLTTGNRNFALARYNSNGSLDTTFSGDGKQVTDLGRSDFAYDAALQSDGKIVVVGSSCDDAGCDLAVARYMPGGSLDTTFSGDGKKVVDYGGQDNGSQGGVAIRSDGKIVIAGFFFDATKNALVFAVYRLNSNGSPDPAFGGDGMVSFDFGNEDWTDTAYDLALQSNGKIVVGGSTWNRGTGESKFAVARLTSNGTLDSTFSVDGLKTTGFDTNAESYALALQSDGKIVLAGHNGGRFALARYNPGGSLDNTFSGDGRVTTPFFDSSGVQTEAICWDVAILSNGNLVAGGEMYNSNSGRNFAIVRYNANGSLDTAFGRQTINFSGFDNDIGRALGVQANGRYVLAGVSETDFALARFLP
jgi:uncharacterized delta-60 repeat protein